MRSYISQLIMLKKIRHRVGRTSIGKRLKPLLIRLSKREKKLPALPGLSSELQSQLSHARDMTVDLINESCSITKAGSYRLVSDICGPIDINAHDVFLDLDSFKLTGERSPDTTSVAISIAPGSKRIKIRGGLISGFHYGLRADHVEDLSVEMATLIGQNFRGIRADGMQICVRRCRIESVGGASVYSDAYAMAIEINGENVVIEDNVIRGVYPTDSGEGVGILVGAGGNTARISNNIISNDRYPSSGRTFGIWAGGSNATVTGNFIAKMSYGIAGLGAKENYLIDICCSDERSENLWAQTGEQPLCPDDYQVATRASDPLDRNSMFRLAQVHHRAGSSLLACAYYELAARLGSSEASDEAARQVQFGYVMPGEVDDYKIMADILSRHYKRIVGAAQAEASTDSMTSLFQAISNEDLQGIRRAVRSGADVNGMKADGVTPLVAAASKGSNSAAMALLEMGADPNIQTKDKLIAFDFARHSGNLKLENLLSVASSGNTNHEALATASKCGCGTCRDLADFLDNAELVLPAAGWAAYQERIRQVGEADATRIRAELEHTNYRALFEQLFGSEALACALPIAGNLSVIRSPMNLGAYETDYAARHGKDLVDHLKGNYDAAEALFREVLPDSYFEKEPRIVCEIGGAWGGSIKHFTDRFKIDDYQNYEPDLHYSNWASERFGVRKMPVDGETLSATDDDSVDLVMANSVFIIVPPMKIWSYLTEMRRVVKKGGLVVFNAIVSDQVSEQLCRDYMSGYFPRRTFQIVPRDVVDRTFPTPDFELLGIYRKEYFTFRRVN